MSDYRVVKTYEEVRKSISNFNRDLEGSDVLKSRLSSVRAWYYVPEEDAVGPSKFIGYNGMTEKKYAKFTSDASSCSILGARNWAGSGFSAPGSLPNPPTDEP